MFSLESAIGGIMLRPMLTVVGASWNPVIELFFRLRCLLTTMVTERKYATSEDTMWYLSIVSEIVPIVLLIIQVMVILSILQPD